MQIDDRWHFTAINNGKGWQLIDNLIYALEIYYSEWQRAAQAWCVSSADAWRARSRSAYSAYNGGPSQICRWADPDSMWVGFDRAFADKYDFQAWTSYVSDASAASPINVICLVEGNEVCPPNNIDK